MFYFLEFYFLESPSGLNVGLDATSELLVGDLRLLLASEGRQLDELVVSHAASLLGPKNLDGLRLVSILLNHAVQLFVRDGGEARVDGLGRSSLLNHSLRLLGGSGRSGGAGDARSVGLDDRGREELRSALIAGLDAASLDAVTVGEELAALDACKQVRGALACIGFLPKL